MSIILESSEYLKMTIIFKSSYGYMIEKPIEQLTKKEKLFIHDNNFHPVIYIGFLKNKKYDGKGFTFYNGNIDCYSVFEKGKKNGMTVEFDKNDIIIFQGNYKNGKKHGYGQWFDVDEEGNNRHLVYEGYLENDKYHGQGKLYNKELIYIGNFENNRLNGLAKIINRENHKCIFEGNFVKNHIQGQGVCYLYDENGQIYSQYTGDFENCMWHGFGILRTINSIYEGTFKKGKLIHGKKFAFGKLIYDGFYSKDYEYHGHGCLVENDETIYVGNFKNGLKHGQGVLMKFDTLDVIYEGPFEKNHMKVYSREYLVQEFELKKLLELGDVRPKFISKLSEKIKRKTLEKFMNTRNIPFVKHNRKKDLLEKIVYFHHLENPSRSSCSKIKKEYLIEFIHHKNGVVKKKLRHKTKPQLLKLLESEPLTTNDDDDSYDFFGNEIQTPILGIDGVIYDEKSVLELQKRNMQPVLFNGIPLTKFYKYDEVVDQPEKKILFQKFASKFNL